MFWDLCFASSNCEAEFGASQKLKQKAEVCHDVEAALLSDKCDLRKNSNVTEQDNLTETRLSITTHIDMIFVARLSTLRGNFQLPEAVSNVQSHSNKTENWCKYFLHSVPSGGDLLARCHLENPEKFVEALAMEWISSKLYLQACHVQMFIGNWH